MAGLDSTPDGQGIIAGGTINPIALRQYVLYWDKIDWPDNNLIHIEPGPDINLLQKENILKRSRINIIGSFSSRNWGMAKLNSSMQTIALLENSKIPGEEWAIAQPYSKIILPTELCIEKKLLEVELYQSLPIPHADTPLEEILVFKIRRTAELKAFRHAMDKLYLDVVQAGDIPRARNHAIKDIENTLKDLNDLMRENKWNRLLSTIKAEIDITKLLLGAVAGFQIGSGINCPMSGTLSGVVLSAIKIDIKLLRTLRIIPEKLQPFYYLHYVDEELSRNRQDASLSHFYDHVM